MNDDRVLSKGYPLRLLNGGTGRDYALRMPLCHFGHHDVVVSQHHLSNFINLLRLQLRQKSCRAASRAALVRGKLLAIAEPAGLPLGYLILTAPTRYALWNIK